jgi:hypothetical protein
LLRNYHENENPVAGVNVEADGGVERALAAIGSLLGCPARIAG